MLVLWNAGYTGEKLAEPRLPAAEGGRPPTRLSGRSIISIAAAVCVCAILSMENPELGVEVPGVKTADPVLVELAEDGRSNLLTLAGPIGEGRAGDIALRLGGGIGMRMPVPAFEVLSKRGVRKRLGGRNGE
jgi:hypothetical protein